ncbi:MAG TPA: phospholipase D-like domain-containing protein [Marmoricola sp.]|nr:phospholipase D-like domain-containing protein [Marmoricola sp.]
MKVLSVVLSGFVAVLVALAVLPAPAQAARWMPHEGALFNVPRDPVKQFTLENQLVAAINHAHRGSYIRISVFSFDRKKVAYALVKAHRRGVHVQVLSNDHQFTGANRILRRALGANRFKKSFSYQCTHGCRSYAENLHSKFFLFSHTGGAYNTVMTGSLNFTMNSVRNQYNDLWTSTGSVRLFKAFLTVYNQMRQDKPANPLWFVQKPIPGIELAVTPYPNFSAKNDPIMSILNKVRCWGAKGGTGTPDGRTIVRVNMHSWNNPRGVYLAQKVRSLYAHGCAVQLMYGMAGSAVRSVFANRTSRGYIPVHTDGYDTNMDGVIDLYSHQKELLISGHYGKDRSFRQVLTGSSNWNDDGLIGDEEIFIIQRAPAYKAYTRNFKFIWTKRSHQVHYIKYQGARMTTGTQLSTAGPAWEND